MKLTVVMSWYFRLMCRSCNDLRVPLRTSLILRATPVVLDIVTKIDRSSSIAAFDDEADILTSSPSAGV